MRYEPDTLDAKRLRWHDFSIRDVETLHTDAGAANEMKNVHIILMYWPELRTPPK